MSNDRFTGAPVLIGRKPILEALEREDVTIEKVMIQKGASGYSIDEVRRKTHDRGGQVQFVPAARLAQLAGGANHQGMVAITSSIEYVELESMLNRIAPDIDSVRQTKPIVLVLDQIEDPHNYGAILRSAVASGVAGVVVPSHHMAPLSATVIKASAGTAVRIPIARVTNLADTLDQLKERGYWVAGAAGGGQTSVWQMDWDRPIVLVMGSEGKGIRPRVADSCDFLVHIPMRGPAESLNVSVATGIILFAATRDRT